MSAFAFVKTASTIDDKTGFAIYVFSAVVGFVAGFFGNELISVWKRINRK